METRRRSYLKGKTNEVAKQPKHANQQDEDDEDHLPPPSLSLGSRSYPFQIRSVTSSPSRLAAATPTSSRSRQSASKQKPKTIVPPFPWATNERGRIHTLEYLESKQITTITGEVECSNCKKEYYLSYDLRESFKELEMIFSRLKWTMRERAPQMWTKPEKKRCDHCGHEKSVKSKIAKRKCEINWLFMLLGQTLGDCTLKQLKYFCKHSKSHRTGAFDRVLYLTYLGLCKMLQPNNPLFHRDLIKSS